MPTYEYACEACGKTWETEQRITEPPLRDCPTCGQQKARRLISGSRFVLKGGGWYADGYGSKPSTADKSASEPKPAAETKPDANSESKPAPDQKTTSTSNSAVASASSD